MRDAASNIVVLVVPGRSLAYREPVWGHRNITEIGVGHGNRPFRGFLPTAFG